MERDNASRGMLLIVAAVRSAFCHWPAGVRKKRRRRRPAPPHRWGVGVVAGYACLPELNAVATYKVDHSEIATQGWGVC